MARFNVEGWRPADLPCRADLQGGLPVGLAGSELALVVILRYRAAEVSARPAVWTVAIDAYDYELLTRGEREIVA